MTKKKQSVLFSFFHSLLMLLFLSSAHAQLNEEGVINYQVSLENLGYQSGLKAYGVDGTVGFDFRLPEQEEVLQLEVQFLYRLSSSLLEEVSHAIVYLNENVTEVIKIDKELKEDIQKKTVFFPVELLAKQNVIAVQLIGHYTFSCEDPMHTSLWMTIEPDTTLSFKTRKHALVNDLAYLPIPFFEGLSRSPTSLPFVFYDTSPPFLEAAAAAASWFGLKAAYQGISFPTLIKQVPKQGHAVVMLNGSDSLPDWLPETVREKSPYIGVIDNPNDSNGKLLLIKGNGADEIKTAAYALALGGDLLSGPFVVPTRLYEGERKPYDAPAWIDTSRPIRLRELAPTETLTAAGFFANDVTLGMRLPPDLFSWKDKPVPLHLRYRYSFQASEETAILRVQVNNTQVAAISLENRNQFGLGQVNTHTGFEEQVVPLSIASLGSVARLQFQFKYHTPTLGTCQNSIVDSYRSAIDPSSTIDLRSFPHFLAMPNLAAFATAGFPYTKLADLSETVVVLSSTPTNDEYAVFLTLMGKMAANTGYPVTRVQVQTGHNVKNLKNKDVILLSFDQTHPLLKKWQSFLPKDYESSGVSQEESKPVLSRLWSWMMFENNSLALPTQRESGTPLVITQFESPVTSKRTVVVLSAVEAGSAFKRVQQLIADPLATAKVQGEMASIDADGVKSVMTDPSYYIGQLTLWMTMLWHLEQHPMLLIVLFLMGALLMSLVLFWLLRAQALHRLSLNTQINGIEKESDNG